MGTGKRSIAVAIAGILFVVAAHWIPKEYLTSDMKTIITEALVGLYGIFMAAKGNKIVKLLGNK